MAYPRVRQQDRAQVIRTRYDPDMAKIFISHSGSDSDLVGLFQRAFDSTGVSPIFEEFNDPKKDPVTSARIRLDIETSNAVFVLLSKHAENIPHTRDWILWEAGVSSGRRKDVWVFEDFRPGDNIRIAVPQLTHYLWFPLNEAALPYISAIVGSYDDSGILPATLLGAGLGASAADRKRDRGAGAVIGGLVGMVLAAASRGKDRPLGPRISCAACHSIYSIHLPEGQLAFRCPSCNVGLRLTSQTSPA